MPNISTNRAIIKTSGENYLWESKMCRGALIFRRSNNFTVLSVEPVATTHSLKGLKAKQLTWQDTHD